MFLLFMGFLIGQFPYSLCIFTLGAGIVLILVSNVISLRSRNRFAPVWWSVPTGGVTILLTMLSFTEFVSEKHIFLPLIIMLFYIVASIIFLSIFNAVAKSKNR